MTKKQLIEGNIDRKSSTNKELTCRICAETKAIELFRRDAKDKSGYQNICRRCRSIHRKQNGETHRVRANSYAQRAGQKVPLVPWEYIAELYKQDCSYCGVSLTTENVVATCDHVYPMGVDPSIKRYGGANIPQNVLPACKKCNCTKQELFAIEAFDRYPQQFKPELLRPFVQRFIGGLINRELTDLEVDQMIIHLRSEAEEVRRNEAKAKELAVKAIG